MNKFRCGQTGLDNSRCAAVVAVFRNLHVTVFWSIWRILTNKVGALKRSATNGTASLAFLGGRVAFLGGRVLILDIYLWGQTPEQRARGARFT